MKSDLETNAKLRIIVRTLLEMGENAVRPANQNAPIYKGEEFATVQIISEVAQGTDESRWEDVGEDRRLAIEHLSGVRLVTANIQYYNGDAFHQLRLLGDRLQSAMGTQLLEDFGFGFSVVAALTDLTGLLPDVEWQTRALMRFEFHAEHNDAVYTPLIVKVPVTTHLHNGLTIESEVTTQ